MLDRVVVASFIMFIAFTSCVKIEEDYNTEGAFHSVQLKHSLIQGIDGFVIGDYKVLAKRKVKELQVLECNGSSCQGSYYKFDTKGNMIYAAPSYNMSYTKFEYDKYHNLQKELVSYDGEKIEATRSYKYFKDSVVVKLRDEDGLLLYEDEVSNPTFIHDVEYSDPSHVSSQTIFDMMFPCGEEFLQENKISFEYQNQGLIEKVTIVNLLSQEAKSFEFEYTY